ILTRRRGGRVGSAQREIAWRLWLYCRHFPFFRGLFYRHYRSLRQGRILPNATGLIGMGSAGEQEDRAPVTRVQHLDKERARRFAECARVRPASSRFVFQTGSFRSLAERGRKSSERKLPVWKTNRLLA